MRQKEDGVNSEKYLASNVRFWPISACHLGDFSSA
jgi:hypothetical protein